MRHERTTRRVRPQRGRVGRPPKGSVRSAGVDGAHAWVRASRPLPPVAARVESSHNEESRWMLILALAGEPGIGTKLCQSQARVRARPSRDSRGLPADAATKGTGGPSLSAGSTRAVRDGAGDGRRRGDARGLQGTLSVGPLDAKAGVLVNSKIPLPGATPGAWCNTGAVEGRAARTPHGRDTQWSSTPLWHAHPPTRLNGQAWRRRGSRPRRVRPELDDISVRIVEIDRASRSSCAPAVGRTVEHRESGRGRQLSDVDVHND